MNSQLENLEVEIENLTNRLDDATKIVAEEVISLIREELNKLKDEVADLKKDEVADLKKDEKNIAITIEDIDKIKELFLVYLDKDCENFKTNSYSSYKIQNYEMSISYDNEIELNNATVDIGDYWQNCFNINFSSFVEYIINNGDNEAMQLQIKYLSYELFDLLREVVMKNIEDMSTVIEFNEFYDFEVELDSYKKLEITEITISSDEFESVFNYNFDADDLDIENVIKNFYNYIDEDTEE